MASDRALGNLLRDTAEFWHRGNPLLGAPEDLVADQVLASKSPTAGFAAVFSQSELSLDTDLEAAWGCLQTYRALPLFSRRIAARELQEMIEALRDAYVHRDRRNACLSVSWPVIPSAPFPGAEGFKLLSNLAVCTQLGVRFSNSGERPQVLPLAKRNLADAADLWLGLVREEERWGAVFERPATRGLLAERLARMLTDAESSIYTAMRNEAVIGLIVAHKVSPHDSLARRLSVSSTVYIDALFVRPEFRTEKVGSSLVERLFEASVAEGARSFALHFSQGSPTSPGFWRTMGFERVWETWRSIKT